MFEIVHEDAELLVVNKPADLVCHPTKGDVYSSLISRVRLHLGVGSNPQMINRLDRETSGLVLVAKDEVAARELRRIWERRGVEKDYLAVVHGAVAEAYGVIDAPLGRDEGSRVAIKDCVRLDGAESRTEFWRERIFARGAGSFRCCGCGRTRGGSIRFGFIWRIGGIRLWAINCMAGRRIVISRWWRGG